MMKIFSPIFNIFRFHKLKIVALAGFYLIFMYFMFPFNDLGDLVSTKISQATQGQVVVDFDNLAMSLLPSPGISLSNVSLETPYTPPLSARSLEVAPSIAGLLSFKPGVTVRAEDLFGGDVTLSTRGGEKTPAGKLKQKISMDFSNVNVGAITKLVDLPVKIDGNLSGSMDSQVDPDLAEQPTANITAQGDRFVVPDGTVPTQMGPLPLPRMNLGEITFDGKLDQGSLDISKLIVGRPGGDLYLNIVGRVDLKIMRTLAGAQPVSGAYDFSVHLQMSDAVKQKFGPFLSLLQSYAGAGNSYAFRMSGAGPEAPPNITRIQ